MKRRTLLTSTLAAAPLHALAQKRAKPVIGILCSGAPDDPPVVLNLKWFRRGLKQEGFVEGENVEIVYCWARGRLNLLPGLAAELVRLQVAVLVNEGGTLTAQEAKKATSTIPIVFNTSDAFEDGLVENLARPAGNATGVSQFTVETLVKAYQLLAELVPDAKGIVIVSAGQSPTVIDRLAREIETKLHVQPRHFKLTTPEDQEAVYAELARSQFAAVVQATASHVPQLVELAARHRVPAAYNQRAYAEAGGLMSYGVSIPAAYLIKGLYTGRILKGAKPSELPVQQPSRLELVVNLKTAQELRLKVPQTILLAADEVIE